MVQHGDLRQSREAGCSSKSTEDTAVGPRRIGAALAGGLRPGDANGAPHPDDASYRQKFSGKYTRRTITGGVGHNLPQEAPQAFADADVGVDGY
jgi:hypothetical protein